jgi:hypothetical protein
MNLELFCESRPDFDFDIFDVLIEEVQFHKKQDRF